MFKVGGDNGKNIGEGSIKKKSLKKLTLVQDSKEVPKRPFP